MTKEQKEWIDSANYAQLLSKWRFAQGNEPLFQGECGAYYSQVMRQKKEEHPNPGEVSKLIGWG
jgi:hypothetical protein